MRKIFFKNLEASQGFTLIEVVVSVALFIVLAVGMVGLVSIVLTTSGQKGGGLADSDEARKVSFGLISELRNAVASNTGAYALSAANNQDIIFYANVDGGLDVERIRYFIQNGALYKGLLKPTGAPFVYNPANETTWIVQRNIANDVNPLFYYYDDGYNGVTDVPLVQPVNVTQVRYVKMKMQIYNKQGVKNQTYYTVTVGGTFRGLKTNLGN